jgi:hypothetical protein
MPLKQKYVAKEKNDYTAIYNMMSKQEMSTTVHENKNFFNTIFTF